MTKPSFSSFTGYVCRIHGVCSCIYQSSGWQEDATSGKRTIPDKGYESTSCERRKSDRRRRESNCALRQWSISMPERRLHPTRLCVRQRLRLCQLRRWEPRKMPRLHWWEELMPPFNDWSCHVLPTNIPVGLRPYYDEFEWTYIQTHVLAQCTCASTHERIQIW